MQKVWNVKKYNNDEVKDIMNKYNISEILAKLIISRNVEDIDMYLNGDLSSLRDPYLICDMDKLIDRIYNAINNNEKICIYGDYDVDGITSITIMYKFLKSLGADVCYYLPDRLVEGYGVNKDALDKIKAKGVKLVITVDCGITAIEETEYAKELGIDMCITDHHECSEIIPSCIAVVDPKRKDDNYPFKMLAGVGVAFKTIVALAIKYNIEKEEYLKYLDIVAIGTISDIVPLVDENRIISKFGLQMLKKTSNQGIKALLETINYKEIDSTMISFLVAPRINACGRLGKAEVAVELLLEEDENKAKIKALKLDELNSTRQEILKDILDNATNIIESSTTIKENNSIVLYNETWHNGVIGIVASNLVSIYNKPVILFTKENGVIRGSGRCPSGFSLYDALSKSDKYLIQFGGHELAAGMSVKEEELENFKNEFERQVTILNGNIKEQTIDVDMEIKKEDLNANILKDIRKIRPYGQSNPSPLFIYKDLKITAIRTLKDEKHLKFILRDDKYLIEALAFSKGDRRDEFKVGDKINVICSVELNTYNTPKTIQFILEDFKKSID